MQELNRLQSIVIVCIVGIVVSFGGAVYTAIKTTREAKALEIPPAKLAIPATAN
jgi:hypothetical protein